MPSKTKARTGPDRSADPAELEALIEEARQRARSRRRRYLLAALAVGVAAVAVALVLAGGDEGAVTGSDTSPESFGVDAQSGVAQGTFTLGLRPDEGAGGQAISGGTTIAFEGPFVASDEGTPQFDLALRWDESGGEPISFSLVAAESAGFLVLGDRAYQASQEAFDQIRGAEVLSALEPERWLEAGTSRAVDEGAGEVVSVLGRLDVGALASDLTRAVNGLGLERDVEAPGPSSLVERRLSFQSSPTGGLEGLALEVGWAGKSEEMGAFTSTVSADIEFNELDEPQGVQAPDGARPIETADLREFPQELWGLVEFLQRP